MWGFDGELLQVLNAPHPALTAASMASGDPPRTPASGVPELARGGRLGGPRGRAEAPMAAKSTARASRTARGGRSRPRRRPAVPELGFAPGSGRRAEVRPRRIPEFLRRQPSGGSRSRRPTERGQLDFACGAIGARDGHLGRGTERGDGAGASPASGGGMGGRGRCVRGELGGRRPLVFLFLWSSCVLCFLELRFP
jgi:hypothetical protein